MALNSDFKVKDSLYVGSSACFVTQTDTPRILSAGTDLWDIFLQDGEVSASCTLSNGTGIATVSFDGTADATVSVDATCNTTWNSAYTTTQANSASWVNAAAWCTTNGNNVIDTVAEGNAQGRIAVTDIGNTTAQVDVNGLQTGDSPTFGGLALNGALTTSSTVDGRDIAADAAQLAILQGLSAGNITGASSPSQGTVRITDQEGNNTDVDTGLQTADSPTFAGVCADNIQIGITGANEIDTASGNLTIDSAGGTVIIDDNTTLCGAVTLGTGTVAGTSNTVLVSDGGQVKTDVIDSRVWGTTLIDGSGTANKITMWSDANTVTDSIITQNGSNNAINIAGGVTITDNLSVMGTFTCLDTSVSTTSALSVINTGTGPAFYAEQTGVSQPIAKFVDTEGGQMVIGDTGNVGIGGSTDNPTEKLSVTGNIAVTGTVDGVDVSARDAQLAVLQGLSAGNITTGSVASQGTMRLTDQAGNNTDVDLGLQVGDSPTFVAASFTGLPTATDNTVVIMDGNTVSTDEIDAKVWGTALVDGEGTQNKVSKYTNGTGTIGDSAITDTGSLVTIDSDTKIDANHALQVFATGGARYSEDKTFTATVGTTATTVTTFAKANLKSAEFSVTLIKGVNITAFKVFAVYNGTAASGTTYAIVDAQAASQLADVTIATTGTTIDLDITAASATTTAVVKGTATY